MSRTETSSVGIAKRYPPCAPRWLSIIFARRSSPKICSRNLSGMRWRRANSATPSGQSRSLSASSISALTAYLLFCVSLKTDHPTNENIPPRKIVAERDKEQSPKSVLRGVRPRGLLRDDELSGKGFQASGKTPETCSLFSTQHH